jgi:hypothetical protein
MNPELNDAYATLECPMNPEHDLVCEKIRDAGFCFVPASDASRLVDVDIGSREWGAFAASWNGMPQDTYMADGGRYRRRRHATLSMSANATKAKLEPHQPHYQSLDYNTLNGGIARHFEPVAESVVRGPVMSALLSLCAEVFGRCAQGCKWHIEAHQFRIEANAAASGQPTPEGVHRDGVDYVLVMMVKRHNIREGTTTIHDPAGHTLASFTLREPLDLTLIDDHRCLHGVTAVTPLDPTETAWRDVLVVTFRAVIAIPPTLPLPDATDP